MTKPLKAALLSALAYPGAGQIFLKRYPSGITFIIIATIGLYYIISHSFKIAFQIIEQVQNGAAPPDSAAIFALVTQHANGSEGQLLGNITAVMIVTWVLSTIHAYMAGKSSEKRM